MPVEVDCQPNREASYPWMFGSSVPQLALLLSMRLNPACWAEAFIRSYSFDRRGLLAANFSRTSTGVLTPASVSSCLAPATSALSYALIPFAATIVLYRGEPGTVV